MLQIKRTTSDNPDFIALVRLLDAYLAEIDGEDHAFYAQFNKVASLKNVVLGYLDGKPIACGAFKPFDEKSVEIKRMYVLPAWRGKGFASQILAALEGWTTELGFIRCVLETGKRQPEAIALYTKCGYAHTPNFGQYVDVENSACFEKILV